MLNAWRTSSTVAFGTLPMRFFVYGLKTSIARSPLRPAPTLSPAIRIASCRYEMTAPTLPSVAAPRGGVPPPSGGRAGAASRDMVEGEIEGIEVAPAPFRVDVAELAVDDQRHALLGDAAVRAQRRVEAGEVVP